MGLTLSSGRSVALDTAILVYFLERHPRYYEAVHGVLHRVETGDLKGFASSLVFAELLVPLYRSGNVAKAREILRVLRAFPNLAIDPVSDEISSEAARLRAEHGVRTPDAIHFATALENEADVFLTNDRRLRRLAVEGPVVQVLSP